MDDSTESERRFSAKVTRDLWTLTELNAILDSPELAEILALED